MYKVPPSLTLIRHGESEGNLARRLFDKGTPHPKETDLMKVHTSSRRLTPKGIGEAQRAGEWARREWLEPLQVQGANTRLITSTYIRAIETAGHLGFGDQWHLDNRVVERSWGDVDMLTYDERIVKYADIYQEAGEDAFFWMPPGGESLQGVMQRLHDLLTTTLSHECHDKHVFITTHGETMWAWRVLLEHWTPQMLVQTQAERSTKTKHINCRIIQYSRFTDSGEDTGKFCRVRFIDPSRPDDPDWNQDWMPIVKPVYTHAQLRAIAEQHKQLLV